MVLLIKTSDDLAYLGIKQGDKILDKSWSAGRKLSLELLSQFKDLLDAFPSSIEELEAVVIYKGPGSYTGLRIGFSFANAIGYSQGIPVISADGEHWNEVSFVSTNKIFKPAYPFYGGEANITKPVK